MPRERALPIVYGTLVFLLSACATAAHGDGKDAKVRGVEKYASDPRLGEEVSRMCFVSSVDSFSLATDDTIVLEVSPTRSYLVEVSGACSKLDSAQSVALDAHSSCASRGDHLLVSDSAFGLKQASGFGPDRCMIKNIHEWDKRAKTDEADEKQD